MVQKQGINVDELPCMIPKLTFCFVAVSSIPKLTFCFVAVSSIPKLTFCFVAVSSKFHFIQVHW